MAPILLLGGAAAVLFFALSQSKKPKATEPKAPGSLPEGSVMRGGPSVASVPATVGPAAGVFRAPLDPRFSALVLDVLVNDLGRTNLMATAFDQKSAHALLKGEEKVEFGRRMIEVEPLADSDNAVPEGTLPLGIVQRPMRETLRKYALPTRMRVTVPVALVRDAAEAGRLQLFAQHPSDPALLTAGPVAYVDLGDPMAVEVLSAPNLAAGDVLVTGMYAVPA